MSDLDQTITVKPLEIPRDISPLELFECIAHLPWSMWLDSCNSQHIDNRYDIMVWSPECTLETQENNTQIRKSGYQKTYKNIDPLALLKQTQEDVFSGHSIENSQWPFCGGAVGYFAYDLGRQFEQLPEVAIADIALPDMAIGIYKHAIIFDKASSRFYLSCENALRTTLTADILNWKNPPSPTAFQLSAPWQANMTKTEYLEKFEQVQSYLTNGDCYQINLAQRFSSQYQGDEFDAYKKLRIENNAPFSAFIRFHASAILSISPERFLQVSEQKVQSKPIKGTRPRSSNEIEDKRAAVELQHSVKDRAENLMIVDLLRNDISKACIAGSVKVPKIFDIESFPAVHHLVSTVEGTLSNDADSTDLLRGAFPGGSITGAPKIRAMEIIESLEPNRRSVYCGSIGYLSACGNMDTSITIRTLICEGDHIHCWAGGGLVADSLPESEYQETFDKVDKILPVLSNC